MTKILNVVALAKDWLFAGDEPEEEDVHVYEEFKEFLTQALTAQRTALLTELRDSGLLKNKPMSVFSFVLRGEELEQYMRYKGHNLAVEAIKAYLDKLIKSNNV